MDVTGKPINLDQLAGELATAGVAVPNGLGLMGPGAESPAVNLSTFDTAGLPQELPPQAVPVVNAHVAMRCKTDAEMAAEFQNPNTTAARKQEIRDIQNGLMPCEQVPM